MERLTVEDAFAIAYMTLGVVAVMFAWSYRDVWLPVLVWLWRAGRQVTRALASIVAYFVEVRRTPPYASAPARTRAAEDADDAWLQNALARGAEDAGVRAEAPISPRSLVLAPEEIAAVARMVAHNKTLAKPNKLATIQAGWPAIKNRSGDPKSQYARASAIYDAIFSPSDQIRYPTLTAERERARREAEAI